MIASSADITVQGQPFCDWFAASLHGKPDWHAPISFDGFATVFDAWPEPLSVEQFVALFAVFYNETGGRFVPIAELGGARYCFEARLPGGGTKRSYNAPPNRLAGDQMVERGLGLTAEQRAAWNGKVWPGGEFADAAQDADFYKYRGRGLIQTTWRNNYQADVDPLLAAAGYACCDDLSTDDLDRVFLTEPSVYVGAVRSFFARMCAAWPGVSEQKWAPVGAHVSGSQAYGAGVYARRCAAVYAALDR